MSRRTFLIAFVLLLLAAAYAAVGMFYPLSHHTEPFEAQVRRGATFKQAAMSLGSQGLVRDPVLFMLAGYASGLHKHLKAGYYAFAAGDYSLWDILKALRAGKIVERTVLITEG